MIAIIGAGFFGLQLAERLAQKGQSVIVLEKETSAMSRASFCNQARVHNGYHYPRNTLTAIRSKASYPKFLTDFSDAIYDDFQSYYLVAKSLSKVSSTQFSQFCNRTGIPFDTAPRAILDKINMRMVDSVLATTEVAFDSEKLKNIAVDRALNAGVKIIYSAEVASVNPQNNKVNLVYFTNGEEKHIECSNVFNCTYSNLNKVLENSGLDITPLKHELVEMCMVQPPPEFKNTGFTVMCGPFFSMMPFPPNNCHSFSHVRYTPRKTWHDHVDGVEQTITKPSKSAWSYIKNDAARYIPALQDCEYKKSLYEVKSILPSTEGNDARPILFLKDHGFKGFHSILGGKIDNVYDMFNHIDNIGF